ASNRIITSASTTPGEPPTDSPNHTGVLPLHTIFTTTANISHASKSERINGDFEISSANVQHKHQEESFAQTSTLTTGELQSSSNEISSIATRARSHN
ncbi:unnamed protein product, partial [Brassica rapa]